MLAFAQVLAFSHVALVAHRICAEHGEAIHASQPDTTAAPSVADSSRSSVLLSPDTTAGHDHEHCLCMAHGRERFVVPPRISDGQARVGIAHLRQGLPRPSPADSAALFLLAPKGSPPASL